MTNLLHEMFPPKLETEFDIPSNLFMSSFVSSSPTINSAILKVRINDKAVNFESWFYMKGFKKEQCRESVLNEIGIYLLLSPFDLESYTSSLNIDEMNYLAKLLACFPEFAPSMDIVRQKDYEKITESIVTIMYFMKTQLHRLQEDSWMR